MRDHVKTIDSAATHRDHSGQSHALRVMSRHQYKHITNVMMTRESNASMIYVTPGYIEFDISEYIVEPMRTIQLKDVACNVTASV
jgi:hypothetical protein